MAILENLQWTLLNPFIGIIGVIIGIIGIYLFWRSVKGPRPAYQSKTISLIGEKGNELPEEIEVRFRGNLVPRLSRTHIVFWNSGTATLRKSDIVVADQIRIEIEEDREVLRARVIKSNRDINNLSIEIDNNHRNIANITFDYLEPNDGGVFEILHTNRDMSVQVIGSIIGIPKGLKNHGSLGKSSMSTFGRLRMISERKIYLRYFPLIAMIILGLFFTIIGALPEDVFIKYSKQRSAPASNPQVFILIGGIIYLILPLYLLWTGRRRFPKALQIPE